MEGYIMSNKIEIREKFKSLLIATGKGNAGKAEVIAAMKALGHPVTDDNEADALALLHWALAQMLRDVCAEFLAMRQC